VHLCIHEFSESADRCWSADIDTRPSFAAIEPILKNLLKQANIDSSLNAGLATWDATANSGSSSVKSSTSSVKSSTNSVSPRVEISKWDTSNTNFV
jgi:hypothetical protein